MTTNNSNITRNAILDAFARYQLAGNEAPSAPPITDAKTSTAVITFVKELVGRATSTTQSESESESVPLGTVSVRLHSDLVPLGVQNFASYLHREVGGYLGTSVRLLETDDGAGAVALECGAVAKATTRSSTGASSDGSGENDYGSDTSTNWRTLREPYWRWGGNQHHFAHDGRGLLSWVGGRKDRSDEPEGSQFLITLGKAAELDAEHLVFGSVDSFDPQSARTLDAIERSLKIDDGSTVRISDCRLVSFQLKDILDLDCRYGSDVNWEAVRSLLVLLRSHPSYEKSARWIVGNNGKSPNERNILQAVLHHNAPADIISEAIEIVSGPDIISADPNGSLLPLSMAYKRSVGSSIVSQIIEKMDKSSPDDAASSSYKKVFDEVCISNLEKADVLLLLDKIGCDRKVILQLLEAVVDRFTLVRLTEDDESFTTWWGGEGIIIKSVEGLTMVWDKICCLLYAIEFGEISTYNSGRRGQFSPLGTLLRLGQMRPYYRTAKYRDGTTNRYLDHHDPHLPSKSSDSDEFAISVLRLIEFIGTNFPSILCLPDSEGRLPLHNAATAFYSYREQSESPYGRFVDEFDGSTANFDFNQRSGEKIISYLLKQGDSQHALAKDGNGDTVLSLLLKDMHRRPLVRIQLVLEAFPDLCLVKSSSGTLPFYDALSMSKDMRDEGSVMEQLYVNNCFIDAHIKLGSAFDSSNEDVLRRFYRSVNTSDNEDGSPQKYLDEWDHCAPSAVMTQAARLFGIMGKAEAFGPSFLMEILHFAGGMCASFAEFPLYLDADGFKSAFKSLITATVSDSNIIQLSFFAEHAFARDDDEYEYYEETGRPAERVFFQRLLKVLLEVRPGDCSSFHEGDAPILSFVRTAIPYYKAMAKYDKDKIATIQGEEQPPSWDERTKEERIAELEKDLELIATEAESYLQLFLAGFPEGLNHCDVSGKPLLHAALELASDMDGIAKSILRLEPTTANVVHQGNCPLHVALESGCNLIEDLLAAAPDSLSFRESASSLYPFQVAACSEKAGLDDVYILLRNQPSVLDK